MMQKYTRQLDLETNELYDDDVFVYGIDLDDAEGLMPRQGIFSLRFERIK